MTNPVPVRNSKFCRPSVTIKGDPFLLSQFHRLANVSPAVTRGLAHVKFVIEVWNAICFLIT